MTSLPLHIEPDPDDPECASLFVDGTVDGRPYRFLLDTGAAQSRVSADAYTATLTVAGETSSNGAFNATMTDELVALQALTVGPIEKPGLVVVRTPGAGRPSLVGMDVLGDMALVLDFDRPEVRFAPSGSLPTSWPLRRSPRGHPFLDLDFGAVTGNACWDTGAGITVVHTDFVAANGSLFAAAGSSVGEDSTGRKQETPMYSMAAASVGGITLAAHTVAAVPLPQDPMRMDIVLGYPALRQFNWVMDFPRNRWGASRRPS